MWGNDDCEIILVPIYSRMYAAAVILRMKDNIFLGVERESLGYRDAIFTAFVAFTVKVK